ncbi:hypothetical protein KY290_035089 [Solanum tuberosum]|uniref:C2H2-type domain-containing protein n=1 Tax=Solanum tuberosum TaxID=4113 RepID=A0ABQ7U531_SOLTU|nr:hypothetical protein KY290_035089 [Solanum tuberosum]
MCEADRLKNQAEAFEEMISEVPFRLSLTLFSLAAKRKAITLIEKVANKPSLSGALVCTTSQDGLNDHLQGKKHKRKMAALREHKDDKNCSIGLLPKKPKLMQPMERPSDDLPSEEKLEEGSSATNDNDPPSLLIDDSANDLRKNVAHEMQDNREFTFLCDTCQIGTFFEIVMESHKIGKKHKRKTKTAALGKKSEEGSSSPNNNDPPSLLIDDNADDMRKNTDHEKQNIRGLTFWCDTCKIGTCAEKVIEAHKNGKKNKRKEENKNCSIGLSPVKPQFIQLVEHPSNDMISGKKSEEGSSIPNNNDQP